MGGNVKDQNRGRRSPPHHILQSYGWPVVSVGRNLPAGVERERDSRIDLAGAEGRQREIQRCEGEIIPAFSLLSVEDRTKYHGWCIRQERDAVLALRPPVRVLERDCL